jgi:hypothetical protein
MYTPFLNVSDVIRVSLGPMQIRLLSILVEIRVMRSILSLPRSSLPDSVRPRLPATVASGRRLYYHKRIRAITRRRRRAGARGALQHPLRPAGQRGPLCGMGSTPAVGRT